MNTVEFMEKLGTLYLGDKEEEIYINRISEYSNMLDEKMRETDREPDYEETFKFIAENYPYRAFPNFNHILECMKYKPKKTKSDIKLRGFRVDTDLGVQDFWGYMKKTEEAPLFIRGFKVIEEVLSDDEEENVHPLH